MNKIHGSIYATKILNNGEEIKIENENNLTNLFKNIILSTSITKFLTTACSAPAGKTVLRMPMRKHIASNGGMTTAYSNTNFTLYLLNLDSTDIENLDETLKKNPAYSYTGEVLSNKIVGYADFNYMSGGEAKRGVITPENSIYTINGNNYGVSVKWNPGALDGTINCIMIGTNIIDNYAQGISMVKLIDNNEVAIGESSTVGYYLTAGVSVGEGTGATVYTAPDEILLGNGTEPTKARRVLNLRTGVSTDLASNDVRYNAALFNGVHQSIGNGRLLFHETGEVRNYLGSTSTLIKTLTNGSYCRGAVVSGDYIYVKDGLDGSCSLACYDIETLTKDTSKTITVNWNSNVAGSNTPNNFKIMPFMDGYVCYGTAGSGKESGWGFSVIDEYNNIFDNIDYMPGYIGPINSIHVPESAQGEGDDFYIMITIISSNNTGDSICNGEDTYFNASGNSGNCISRGVGIITDGYYGQVLTYSVLQNPIQITSTDSLKIDYEFHF